MAPGTLIAGWLRPLWPRFAIGELFLLTFAAAVGVWQYRTFAENWSLALTSTVAAWFAGAWIVEAILLLRRSRLLPRDAAAERGGCWVAAFWRIVLVVIVAACVALETAFHAEFDYWWAYDFRAFGGALVRDVPLPLSQLCLALALLTSGVTRRPRGPDPVRTAVWLAAGTLCAALVAATLCMVPFLVHTAIVGMERAQPSRLLPHGLHWDVAAREREFGRWAFLAAATAAANFWLTRLLAWHWGRGRVRVAIVGLLLCAGIAAAAAYVVWLSTEGAYLLSPAWVAGIRAKTLLQYAVAGTAALLAATWVAVRLCGPPRDRLPGAPVPLPPGFSLFGWAPMLAAAVGWWLYSVEGIVRKLEPHVAASYFLFNPQGMAGVALVVLAARHALRAWRWPAEAWAEAPPPIRPLQFACVWLAATATIVTAAPIAAATAFSLLLWLAAVPR